MPRVQRPLLTGRPIVEVTLAYAPNGQQVIRNLLADTGAGSSQSGFELLLDEDDCLLCGGVPLQPIILGGAYVGSFPIYLMQVKIPDLGFDKAVPAVGLPSPPAGVDGIACFRFLNRFNYGNFADPTRFGLET